MTLPERLPFPPFELRPLYRSDVKQAIRLLRPTLDQLYPKGALLFERRLGEVLVGKASSTVVCFNGRVVGLATEVPKGDRRLKISTLWIHPQVRRRGLGFVLAGFLTQRWLRATVSSVHITVAYDRLPPLHGLLGIFGFRGIAIEKGRYGVGRDEAILRWKPEWADSVRLDAKDCQRIWTVMAR
jgi:ribosomal protein S18 acetylase RimI-like enzyme